MFDDCRVNRIDYCVPAIRDFCTTRAGISLSPCLEKINGVNAKQVHHSGDGLLFPVVALDERSPFSLSYPWVSRWRDIPLCGMAPNLGWGEGTDGYLT